MLQYILEVNQDLLILLHKIWAKNCCEKMFFPLEITAQSFRNQSWKSSQSMNKIQKFIQEVDEHEKTDFS